MLRHIPAWPLKSALDGDTFLSADELLFPPKDSIHNEWFPAMNGLHDPMDLLMYKPHLDQLNVKEVSMDTYIRQYVRISELAHIPPGDLEIYIKVVNMLLRSSADVFTTYPMAIDGSRCFRRPQQLFDHRNSTFQAAFGNHSDKMFLHPVLRGSLQWQKYIKREVTGDVFLLCIDKLLDLVATCTPEEIAKKAAMISNYLQSDTPEIQGWDSPTWSRVVGKHFIPANVTFEAFRRKRMKEILPNRGFASLSHCILQDDIGIAWSQLPVLSIRPCPTVVRNMPSNGRPSFGAVLNHLYYLAENNSNVASADVGLYIDDVKATYSYLLEKFREQVFHVDKFRPIWLNIEAPETTTKAQFAAAWTSTNNLCMGLGYDFPPHVYDARPFLQQFSELLEACHVKTLKNVDDLVAPPVTETPAAAAATKKLGGYAGGILRRFQEFRQKQQLFDVSFDVEDQSISAHRLVLCAASEYFRSMFDNPMMERDSKNVPLHEIRPSTVHHVFDYIYTGEIPDIDQHQGVSKELEALTELLEASERFILPELKKVLETRLCNSRYIRPENARWLLEHAQTVNAKLLKKKCKKFISKNAEIVDICSWKPDHLPG